MKGRSMKRNRFLFLLLLLSTGVCADETVAQLGFEQELKPGFVWRNARGKVWFAPDAGTIQDRSGRNAHTGKGAFALKGKVNLCMDTHGFLSPGKRYTLSVWVRPCALYLPFSLNFIWFGNDGKVLQQNSAARTLRDTAWQKISVTAEAPRDFRNVYFLIHTGHSDRIVYLDDLQLAEQPSQSRTERDVL